MGTRKIPRMAIAAALFACIGAVGMDVFDHGEYEELTSEQQLQVARPLGGAGDSEIRDMSVVMGR